MDKDKFLLKDRIAEIEKSFVKDGWITPTQLMDTTKGTVFFGAYNTITGYFQNVRNYKNDEAKLTSLLMGGTGQIRTQSAFNLYLDFATKGWDALILN